MQKHMAKQTGSKRWIEADESAAELLARVSTERPSLLLPPLHRVPLRIGNVVELIGPSSSAKTLILMQAAVSCILPKEWKGVHYGGLDRSVMFIDLDCRFEILCFSEMLNHRIMEPNWSKNKPDLDRKDVSVRTADTRRKHIAYDEELYALCMRRFLYVRCYDSFEFLSTLKTLHYQLQKDKEMQQSNVHLLMIDSIGAFHWVDRASTFLPYDSNRKNISLQSISENVVQEMRKLLLVHPMLVIATKSTNSWGRHSANEVQRSKSFPDSKDLRGATSNSQQHPYREYMPSAIWQGFVTHRILVRAVDDHLNSGLSQSNSIYLSEWFLPSLSFLDKFIVKDGGVLVVS